MGEVSCGNCGAPVKGEPGAMACPYCGTRVDIPLAAPQRRQNDQELRDLERLEAEERERARRHDRYEEDEEPPRRESSSSSSTPIVFAVVAVVAVVFVGAFVGAAKSRSKKTSTKDERKSTATATTTTSKKTAPPAYVENVVIPSCKCAFGDGQSTPLVTLSLRAAPLMDPTRPFDLRIERQSGFVSEMRSSVLSMSNPNALSANDAGALPAHLGVACDTGVYVLVADKTASAWSSVNASWKWTTTLPATMMDGADASAPIPPKGAGFAPFCTPLTTQNGNATLVLANGRKATLSLKDGKLR